MKEIKCGELVKIVGPIHGRRYVYVVTQRFGKKDDIKGYVPRNILKPCGSYLEKKIDNGNKFLVRVTGLPVDSKGEDMNGLIGSVQGYTRKTEKTEKGEERSGLFCKIRLGREHGIK